MFEWSPAQYAFVRAPKIAPFQNHPFTMAAAPLELRWPSDGNAEGVVVVERERRLLFPARARDGFTRRLINYAANQSAGGKADVWIDGPYGGVSRPLERLYDTMILLDGGTRITSCRPWLIQMVALANLESGNINEKVMRLTKTVLVWATGHANSLSWVKKEQKVVVTATTQGVQVVISSHITADDVRSMSKKRVNMRRGLPLML